MSIVDWILYGLVSAALVWAALSDWKTLRIPRVAGWGVLAAGLVSLLAHGLWLEALLLFGVVLASSFRGTGPFLIVLILGGVLLANHPASLPLVVGLAYVFLAFRLGWLGGGDAQLALGLLAIARDWWMPALLFGVYGLLSLGVVLARRGPAGAVRRLVWVGRHLDQAEIDTEAVRVPWAVVAGICGLGYLWLLPVLGWR